MSTRSRCVDENAFLSWNQEREIFIRHRLRALGLEGNRPPLCSVYRLNDDIDLDRLRYACKAACVRHTSLRTIFRRAPDISAQQERARLSFFAETSLTAPGTFRQCVLRDWQANPDIRTVHADLADLVEAATPNVLDHAREWLPAEDQPPFRISVLVPRSGARLLVISADRLIADLFSLGIIRADINASYRAIDREQDASSRAPLLQYRDFSAYQHSMRWSTEFRRSAAFWHSQWSERQRAQDSGVDVETTGADDRRRSDQPQCEWVCLTEDETTAVRVSAQRQAVSTYIFILCAICITLRSRAHPVVGLWMPFANRCWPGTSTMVGWCTNTHRIAVPPQMSEITDALAALAIAVNSAIEHQTVPLQYVWHAARRCLDVSADKIVVSYRVNRPPRTTDDAIHDEIGITRWTNPYAYCEWIVDDRVKTISIRITTRAKGTGTSNQSYSEALRQCLTRMTRQHSTRVAQLI